MLRSFTAERLFLGLLLSVDILALTKDALVAAIGAGNLLVQINRLSLATLVASPTLVRTNGAMALP